MAKDEIQIKAKIGRKLTPEEEKNKASAQAGHAKKVNLDAVQGQWLPGVYPVICPGCGTMAWYDVPPVFHICSVCGDQFFWVP